MANIHCPKCTTSRREMLRTGLFGLGIRTALPAIFGHTSLSIAAQAFQGGAEAHPERIMVVVELTGGNDGLDTVAPYTNDAYHKARPTLGGKKSDALVINDEIGFHPRLGGMKAIYDEGRVALVQG